MSGIALQMTIVATDPERSGTDACEGRGCGVRVRSHPGFERWLPWLLFIIGAVAAVRYPSVNASPGESGQAAIALLNLGYIGNPYILPTGPTAHVSPSLACLLAGVYWMFGENAAPARIVLGIIAALMYALGVRAVLRICATCGAGRLAVWIACGLTVLLPMSLFQSVTDYRQWDQPFGALILVQGWLVFEASNFSRRRCLPEVQMAVLAGLGVLFSPAIFPALLASLAMMIWMRRRIGDRKRSVLVSAVVIAACLLPWGVRNRIELGKFILTRSNFGLELATGNAPGATGASGSGSGAPLHPHDSITAAAEVQSIGEVAYMQKMTDQAEAWIIADPARFLRLSVERVKLAFFPSRQMMGWVPGMGTELPWILFTVFGAFRAAALIAAFLFRIRPVPVFLYTVLPLAPYFVTHVNLRYEFTIFFTAIVAIAVVGQRALSAAGKLIAAPRRHDPAAGSSET